MYVYCLYLLCIYSIENIYMHIHLYIYILIFYIIYKYIS